MFEIPKQLKIAAQKLANFSVPLPGLEAELLLSLAMGKSREFILANPETELSSADFKKFKKLVNRRATHEPFSYISGEKDFMGLTFVVTPDTLIPRPETEQMVEEAIKTIKSVERKKVLVADIGTGSGCIAVSTAFLLQKENLLSPATSVVACDYSASAIAVCKENIKKHSLEKNILTFQGDLLEPIFQNNLLGNKEVFIALANLPYLSEEIYESCPKTVQKFEPKSALYSPEAGLFHYKKMLEQILDLKQKKSKLKIFVLLEISPEQKEPLSAFISAIFSEKQTSLEFSKDLAGKWRLAKLEIG